MQSKMRIAHHNKFSFDDDLLSQGKQLEGQEEWADAEKVYLKKIEGRPYDEVAYNRLMIVYRKQKKYDEEVKFIKKSIKTFQEWFKETSELNGSRKVATISKSLQKTLGVQEREPIAAWSRRLLVLEKRLKKKK
jgi:hypothetical protein